MDITPYINLPLADLGQNYNLISKFLRDLTVCDQDMTFSGQAVSGDLVREPEIPPRYRSGRCAKDRLKTYSFTAIIYSF